jgi:hypothetical protein
VLVVVVVVVVVVTVTVITNSKDYEWGSDAHETGGASRSYGVATPQQ